MFEMLSRRSILKAVGTSAAAPLSMYGSHASAAPAVNQGRRRVAQEELDEAIALHGMWTEDRNLGRRANFESCDLSGLDFGCNVEAQTVLCNADFTNADLSYIGGNDINFRG